MKQRLRQNIAKRLCSCPESTNINQAYLRERGRSRTLMLQPFLDGSNNEHLTPVYDTPTDAIDTCRCIVLSDSNTPQMHRRTWLWPARPARGDHGRYIRSATGHVSRSWCCLCPRGDHTVAPCQLRAVSIAGCCPSGSDRYINIHKCS